MLRRAAEILDGNDAVSLSHGADLVSIEQAADLLNISRPSLVSLLDEGTLASFTVGNDRVIPLDALSAYRRAVDLRQESALDEMATTRRTGR